MNTRHVLWSMSAIALLGLLTMGASDSGETDSTIVDPVPGQITSSVTAKVASSGLRIRSLPGITGEVISRLTQDDELRVKSKSSWSDTIDGITAPWYEVSKGWTAGWCFGGYLYLDKRVAIATNSIKKDEKKLLHSYFGAAEGKNIGPLPYLSMKIFGVEMPYAIPSQDGFGSAYDRTNAMMFLEVRPVPKNILRVYASDTRGNSYKVDLSQDANPGFQTIAVNEQGFTYSKPITAFRFRAPANTHAGEWVFKVAPDGKENVQGEFKATVDVASATLSPDRRPSPFEYSGTVFSKPDDVLFVFGDAAPNTRIKIAFYQITDQQNKDLSFKMKPVVAGQLASDSSGKYKTTLHVGSDLSPGQYKFGYGEDGMTIDLFDIYLVVR